MLTPHQLPVLAPGQALPPSELSLGHTSHAPGLLALGGDLTAKSLRAAYSQGAFPWFNSDQPIAWWSPDPRMVLPVDAFKISNSFRKSIEKFLENPLCEIRFDFDFEQVIRHCSSSPRKNQNGTWLNQNMISAYLALSRQGLAHSIETWRDNHLLGGLYVVSLGKAVFGESMFSLQANASKIALAALVCFCKIHHIKVIDCQQNTPHLASLGASEMPRSVFLEHIALASKDMAPQWNFFPTYWNQVLTRQSVEL